MVRKHRVKYPSSSLVNKSGLLMDVLEKVVVASTFGLLISDLGRAMERRFRSGENDDADSFNSWRSGSENVLAEYTSTGDEEY
jgi:hypothetical protein